VLFRTKEWLTIGELASAWAHGLSSTEKERELSEVRLTKLLLEDAVNGRFDDTGPLAEGQRLGLRIITPEFRAGFLTGRELLDALKGGADPGFLGHRIVVMKEAALVFAQQHALPTPSWWRHDRDSGPTAREDVPDAAPSRSGTITENAPPKRVRARKLTKVQRNMSEEIQQGKLTTAELENMLEKDLSARYDVSRDTARKARNAVLAELCRSTRTTTNDK
jgi:hypothetical protein